MEDLDLVSDDYHSFYFQIDVMNKKQMEEVSLSITRLINKRPDNLDLYVKRGISLRKREVKNDYSPAIKDFKFVLSRLPNHVQASYNLGITYLDLKKLEKCIQIFEKMIRTSPTDPWGYYGKAYFLLYQAEPNVKDALEETSNVMKYSQPGSTTHQYVLELRGYIYKEMKKFDLAEQTYLEKIELFPSRVGCYLLLGCLYDYCLNDKEKGFKIFERALSICPTYERTNFYLGLHHHYEYKDINRAKEHYTRETELNPLFPNAFERRGYINRSLGLTEDALADFSQSIDLGIKDFYPLIHRGRIHEDNQRFKEAEMDYKKAVEVSGFASIPYEAILLFYSDRFEDVADGLREVHTVRKTIICGSESDKDKMDMYKTSQEFELLAKIFGFCESFLEYFKKTQEIHDKFENKSPSKTKEEKEFRRKTCEKLRNIMRDNKEANRRLRKCLDTFYERDDVGRILRIVRGKNEQNTKDFRVRVNFLMDDFGGAVDVAKIHGKNGVNMIVVPDLLMALVFS